MKYGLFFFVLWVGQILTALPAGATLRKHHTQAQGPADEDSVAQVDPSKPPNVHAACVMLVDADTGEALYAKNPDVAHQIASTTKLMTALLVIESGHLEKLVTVDPADIQCEPTKLNFKPGEQYDRRSLLFALLVHSCNDVARCLARDNAGSLFQFADRMDLRAHELGALNTEFVNPNGLPSPGEDQHSTARDLSRIARAAYANPLIREIVATKTLVFHYADGKTREFTNTNRVLSRYPLCNGMKTGYTDAAGHCLVSSASDGAKTVISVCLGDNQSIWNDSQRLLMWGLAVDKSTGASPFKVSDDSPTPSADGRSVSR